MAHYMAQVIFQGSSGLPEDVFVNTFHFDSNQSDAATATYINALIDDAWNDVHAPGGAALANSMSTMITRAASRIKIYDMSDPIPRVPISDTTWTLGATSSTTDMPNEVAMVVSFKGAPIAGIPLARQRGRVYIGPLTYANTASSGGDARPNSTRLNILDGFGTFLKSTVGGNVQWCVFSQAAKTAGHATGLFPVDSGYVDDAYDTQRRRGAGASTRQAF